MTGFLAALKAFETELDRRAASLCDDADAPAQAASRQKISSAYLQLGKRMSDEGFAEESLALFRKAARIAPGDIEAAYSVLSKLERLNRMEEAWSTLTALENNSISLYETHLELQPIKAQLEYRRGNLDTARELLESFIAATPHHPQVSKAYALLGKVHDTLGHCDDAMRAFHSCNEYISHSPAGIKWIQKSNAVFDKIDTSLRWYGDKKSFDWQDAAIDDRFDSPVLLVGFPRSGTTLLDQILNSHSALTTLEEQATLSGLAEKFYGSEDKLMALERLNGDELTICRETYWANVAQFLEQPMGQSTLVDKLPLNIRYLDLYTRLFPDIKIIVALRDPRDVVLSNYMQVYKLNPEMATSLNLADSARFYARVMELYLLFRKFIPGNIHEIRYEDLVCDFAGESTRLLDFLGLEWHDSLMQYHEHAKKRWINTPSYEQVTQPIYRHALGRWKNYEAHLQAVIPILQPFIDEFGYTSQP